MTAGVGTRLAHLLHHSGPSLRNLQLEHTTVLYLSAVRCFNVMLVIARICQTPLLGRGIAIFVTSHGALPCTFSVWPNIDLPSSHADRFEISYRQDIYSMETHQWSSDYTSELNLSIPRMSGPTSVEAQQYFTALSHVKPTHIAYPSAIYPPSYTVDSQSEGASQFPDSDQDAEGETDEEDGYDYDNDVQDPTYVISSPEPVIRRSNRAARYTSTRSPYHFSRSARTSQSSSSSLGRDTCYDSFDTKPIETKSRLKQATDSAPNYTATNANGDFQCQHCKYTCNPAREVDFVRHVDKHYRQVIPPKGPVLCCGIPITQRDLPQYRGKVPSGALEKRFYGQRMVGGCGKVFTRPDSLKRHLDTRHGYCFGDLLGDWHPQKPQKCN
jgi:hypothetical protein